MTKRNCNPMLCNFTEALHCWDSYVRSDILCNSTSSFLTSARATLVLLFSAVAFPDVNSAHWKIAESSILLSMYKTQVAF